MGAIVMFASIGGKGGRRKGKRGAALGRAGAGASRGREALVRGEPAPAGGRSITRSKPQSPEEREPEGKGETVHTRVNSGGARRAHEPARVEGVGEVAVAH